MVEVRVETGAVVLDAFLEAPAGAGGCVLFAHGSGSSRHSRRNQRVASALRDAGFATLLLDLLTPEEDEVDRRTRELRFDVDLLGGRVEGALQWVGSHAETAGLRRGVFGASTGAAAALLAAAGSPDAVAAVVSRGGRPDLAGEALPRVTAPTLLIVGERDPEVLELNRQARQRLAGDAELEVVPGATHLFEEPGALEAVAGLAARWFDRHLLES